jgi:hypothetical protein
MPQNTCEQRVRVPDTALPEIERLALFIREHFPEEAESGDLATAEGTVNLAIDLLDRLWRWQH